nr:hypothetical protein [Ralstonia solanacearum]
MASMAALRHAARKRQHGLTTTLIYATTPIAEEMRFGAEITFRHFAASQFSSCFKVRH